MRPCQVVARLHGIKGGKGLLEMHFCLGEVAAGVRDASERALGETDDPRMVDVTSDFASLHSELLGFRQLIV